MASLTAHLRQSEDHGRLAFHPDCPACRAERLSGTLPSHGLVTRRTQAAVVATLLAASTATPALALAQEPDQVSEGTLAPGAAPADPALNPDFDPGGNDEDVPFDDPEAPESEPAPDPEAGDPGPLEGEPATDVGAPVADAGDEAAEPVVVTPSPTPTATPTPTPVAPAVPAPDDGEQSAQDVAPDAGPRADKPHRKREPRHHGSADSQGDVEESAPVAPSPEVDTAPTEPRTTVVAQATPPSQEPSERDAATRGDHYHVVQPGESLWLIARDLVGHDASAARVARKVNQLWILNETRIGTGNPDLLMVGTKLVLE
jgi:hypothetical protein